MKMIVSVTKLCGTAHPDQAGVTCARPAGHGGWHLNGDNTINWGTDAAPCRFNQLDMDSTGGAQQPSAPAAPPAPCQASHLSGRRCALTAGHPGSHATADRLFVWATFAPPVGL